MEGFHDGGCYLDGSFDYAGDFVSTPPVTLKKGSYIVTLNYATDSKSHYYRFSSRYNEPEISELYEMALLKPEENHKDILLNPSSEIEDFLIRFYYEEDGYLLINSVEIKETISWRLTHLVSFLVLLFVVDFSYFAVRKHLWKKLSVSKRQAICGVFFISLLSSLPLFCPFAMGGDDLKFHLVRIEELKNSILRLQIPVRMQGGWLNNAGYPVSILYSGDLFLLFPALMRMCGFSVSFSYNGYILMINLITAGVAFYSFKNIFKNEKIGFSGCLLYTLAPYRLTNIYMRAAVGEYTAYSFFPLIALGLYRIFTEDTEDKNYKYSFILPALGYSGIIQSHTLSCEIAGFFTVLICLVLIKRTLQPRRFFALVKVVLFSVLLNLSFLLPFLDYMRGSYKMNQDTRALMIQTYGLFPGQLLSVFPKSLGGSPKISRRLTGVPFMPMTPGLPILAGISLLFYLLIFKKVRSEDKNWRLAVFFGSFGLAVLYMTTCYFPWDALYKAGGFVMLLVKNLQFPWRLMGIAALFLSLSAAGMISYMKKQYEPSIFDRIYHAFTLCALISAAWFFSSLQDNSIYNNYNSLTLDYNEIINGEFLPASANETALLSTAWPVASPSVAVLAYEHTAGNVRMDCINSSGTEGTIDTGLLYYPYYRAVDTAAGQSLPVTMGDNGVIRVTLPGGYNGSIHIFFREPLLWRISELVSLLALSWLTLYWFSRRFTRFRKE